MLVELLHIEWYILIRNSNKKAIWNIAVVSNNAWWEIFSSKHQNLKWCHDKLDNAPLFNQNHYFGVWKSHNAQVFEMVNC
jgi:hypothetical protein